jgi:predicted nucleic acid-binding protein
LTGFLIDTNVVSMLAPSKLEAPADFLQWLDRQDTDGKIFLSVVTIHEIQKGISLLEHKGATAKASALTAWLNGLISAYDDKILAFDAQGAEAAGRLEAKALSAGHDPGMADAVIAGTALAHNLVVITRNFKDFSPFGISVLSPDEASLRIDPY